MTDESDVPEGRGVPSGVRQDARRRELAAFLRAARGRVKPSDVGLPVSPRRRASGLLREEVAQLASMSSSWYAWLEQGRRVHVSEEVLNGVASALRLSDDETNHLFLLAGQSRILLGDHEFQRSDGLRVLLEHLEVAPAYVVDRRWDIVDWNQSALALFGADMEAIPQVERNALRFILTGGHVRLRFVEPVSMVAAYVAQFRADTSPYIGDPDFELQVRTLASDSRLFRELWPRQEIRQRPTGPMHYLHSDVGELSFDFLALQLGDGSALRAHIYLPVRGSDTASKLKELNRVFAERMKLGGAS